MNKFWIISLFILSTPFLKAQNFEIFYLSIGSSHYIQEGSYNYSTAVGANKSAKIMSNLFDELGAKKGITLTSSEDNLISKNNILDNVDKIIEDAKKSNSKNKLIIFYYCGHGMGLPMFEYLFLIPGNVDYKMGEVTTETFLSKVLMHLEVCYKLNQSGIRYIAIFDCCWESEISSERMIEIFNFAIDFNKMMNPKGYDMDSAKLEETYKFIRDINRVYGVDPVIFSCDFSKTAKTV
ncbi:MAG: caspase family protein, partial [Microscillaceae bacterium]|nr:caspase family protein [Microscillaceae bacterium]